MNNAPQVATQEISDADLDNISGGIVGEAVGALTTTVDSVVPVSGTVASAAGTVGSVTGTVEGLSGLNTAGVTGLVAGL